jgi:hypothetical protein
MKKILIFAVVIGLLLPAAAFAKAEFSLGGYIKLDTFWDSTQQGKNLNTPVARNNSPSDQHGQLRFTSQSTRFNFTIKGPKVFGAQTTGFLEMDFDMNNAATTSNGVSNTASSSYMPRLRHAMFRLNWPETELLFGQYWSLFSSWYAEAAEDGPLQTTGTPTARLPQIRLTQKFAGDWSAMGLVGMANAVSGYAANPYSANSNSGSAAETPQIQASLKYNHDWWGKAAYYGHPIPFTAQVMAGWQRNSVRGEDLALTGMNNQAVAARIETGYVNPWLVMGTLFVPVIPTHSANLAGTASLLFQAWIGQGVSAFGFTGDNTAVLNFNSFAPTMGFANNNLYDLDLVKRWGGFLEAQYYFTNQWYLNVAYALSHTYAVNQDLAFSGGAVIPNTAYGAVNSQINWMQQIDATLWWRPVQALKFGLQYSYANAAYWTTEGSTANFGSSVGGLSPTSVAGRTNKGDEHRVEFVGYFFF